jgi:hypothetical protein
MAFSASENLRSHFCGMRALKSHEKFTSFAGEQRTRDTTKKKKMGKEEEDKKRLG